MQTKQRIAVAVISALAIFGISARVAPSRAAVSGQEKPAAAKHPEMDRLQALYLGTWDYTETYAKSPVSPQGGTGSGLYTSEVGPGGFSIVNHFRSKSSIADAEGLLVMTWDPKESAYKCYVFGSEFPASIVETGQFEGDLLVYRAEISAEGMKFKLRNVTRVVSPGKIVSEEYIAPEGSPEMLLVTVDATRRK